MPAPNDATAWYRVVSPMRELQRVMPLATIDLRQGSGADVSTLAQYDVVLLQRPASPEATETARHAKLLGARVWLDYDDAYLAVPKDNPTWGHYGSPAVQEQVRRVAALADAVTVSTPPLVEHYAPHTAGRVVCVPNAIDPRLAALELEAPRLPSMAVTWRGGASHAKDLKVFHRAITQAAWRAEARWHFLGQFFPDLLAAMPPLSCETIPFTGLLEYFERLAALAPSVHIVPLADTPFNHARSPIAMHEALRAGAVPLVPAWPHWLGVPGVAYYRSPSEFREQLVKLLETWPSLLRERAATGWAHVQATASLAEANRTRALVLQQLLTDEPQVLQIPAHKISEVSL